MAKGYWIPHLDVSNPQGFQAYRDTADAWHKTNGSKLLARGGRSEVMEGKMRSRNVIREYDSFDVAVEAYHSPEYSRAHPLREPHSQCDFPIVEGYDGPQPAPVGTPPAAGPRKGYWIAHVDITDAEGYKAYQAANAKPFGMFGARFLVRGRPPGGDGGQGSLPLRDHGISQLRSGARLLSFAGISSGQGSAPGQGRDRSDRQRRLQRRLARSKRCPICGLWWPAPAGAWGAR